MMNFPISHMLMFYIREWCPYSYLEEIDFRKIIQHKTNIYRQHYSGKTMLLVSLEGKDKDFNIYQLNN